MGRVKRWGEVMITKLPKGTIDKLTGVLRRGETCSDVVRRSLFHEMARRGIAEAARWRFRGQGPHGAKRD